jgi:hypothetical protein
MLLDRQLYFFAIPLEKPSGRDMKATKAVVKFAFSSFLLA